MSFPLSPSDNDTYTSAQGTVYKYSTANAAWRISTVNYGLTGIQGTTGSAGSQGATGAGLVDPWQFTEFDIGSVTGAVAVNLFRGSKQKLSIRGTLTVYTAPTGVAGAGTYTLKVVNDSCSAFTYTGIKWPAGVAPVWTTGITGSVDIATVYYDGTSFFGQAGLNFKQ